MRIYLIGFMGAGKSTIGRRLADRFGWPFVDLDKEIEAQAGLSIPRIFEHHGEIEFRRLEADRLCQSVAYDDIVVATGGGTFSHRGNRDLIKKSGVSVWLNPPLEILFARLERPGRRGARPMYRDREQASQLFSERLDGYRSADLEVAVSGLEDPSEVVERIAALLETER